MAKESNNMNKVPVSMRKKKMKRERKRRSTEIAFISNKSRRLVTYYKRRAGLFKKAAEAYLLTGNSVLIVGFSPSGRPFSFSASHPSPASLHAFLDSYLAGNTSTSPEVPRPADEVAKSEPPSLEELRAEKRQLQEARRRVLERLEKLETKKVVCQSDGAKIIAAVQERLSRPPSVRCKCNERDVPRQDLGSSSSSVVSPPSSCQTGASENEVVEERPFPRPVIKCMEEEVGEYWEDYDPALFSSSVVWPQSSPLLQDEDNASLFHNDFDDLLNVVPGNIIS